MTRRRQGGFSLLELLVTLFVIVLATSLVTLNVGGGNRDLALESAVADLAEGANYALDEAQFTGMDYGLLLATRLQRGITHYTWEWLELGPTGWRRPESGKELFAERELPEGVELQLEIEDQVGAEEIFFSGGADPQPQVVLYASGETLPGALDFRSQDDGALLWRVEWGYLGEFQALRRGVPEPEDEP